MAARTSNRNSTRTALGMDTTPVDEAAETAVVENVTADVQNDVEESEAPEGTDQGAEEGTGQEQETVTEEDPFAVLDAATSAEYVRGPRAVDYEAITSPRIKADLKASFEKYEYKKDANGADMVNVPGKSHWMTQKFPTPKMAAMYLDQAKKYAKFMEWTLRSSYVDDTTLRFCAKPKETRVTVK